MALQIAKAHPTVSPVADVQINIGPNVVPEFSGKDASERYQKFYEATASRLEELLIESLPGGTYDALLRHMLTRRASLLRVKARL